MKWVYEKHADGNDLLLNLDDYWEIKADYDSNSILGIDKDRRTRDWLFKGTKEEVRKMFDMFLEWLDDPYDSVFSIPARLEKLHK